MRQPTELAVLLDGIGIVPLADNWGRANICDAIDEGVVKTVAAAAAIEAEMRGVEVVPFDVLIDADDDGVESAIETPKDGVVVEDEVLLLGFPIPPVIMGFAVNEGGNCTVGNDGTGKTSGPPDPPEKPFVVADEVVVRPNAEDVIRPPPPPTKLGKTLASDVANMLAAVVLAKEVGLTSSSVELLVALVKT